MVRVVIEHSNGGAISLRTSDLSELRIRIGNDVFDRFCCCFIHADRLMSLTQFTDLSLKKLERNSAACKRNLFTTICFTVSTLKELGRDLARLRSAMVMANIWDKDAWHAGLHKWEKWADSKDVSTLRNQIAVHIDLDRLSAGVEKVSGENSIIWRSDGQTNGEIWFELATEALLAGAQTGINAKELAVDVNSIVEGLKEYSAVGNDLMAEFFRALRTLGVKPVNMTTRGYGHEQTLAGEGTPA